MEILQMFFAVLTIAIFVILWLATTVGPVVMIGVVIYLVVKHHRKQQATPHPPPPRAELAWKKCCHCGSSVPAKQQCPNCGAPLGV